ncbi:hypothetical protein GG344DRAFT_45574 [Lentinula edodes]|nr:hypothetical protein GG344DRAFT_45574 [Lentinula edodes]
MLSLAAGTKQQAIPHTEHCWQSSSLVRAGIIPTSPLRHTAGVTVRTISLYHKLFVRCPRLGIQPFAKALCDIQGKASKPYLSTQLYEALDVYVAILNGVWTRTREALSRQGREWRMLNACPCCQFRLKEDSNLRVRMIVSMDGNDSLKRVERKEDVLQEQEQGENSQGLPPVLKERIDGRVGGAAYFASRRETNAWDEKNWGEIAELSPEESQPPVGSLWVEGRCEERWQNMKETSISRLSAKFFENGWFVLLCRHMLLLLACNMIQSGELAQYPLALLHIFMAAEKEERDIRQEGRPQGQLAVVYDIACKTSKTVRRSPLNSLAQWSRFLPAVGAMHGYAHERSCQLLFLMLYIVGVGLEDGEGCERYFNVSNALAAITRHQSSFHCRQAISEFAYFNDLQTYSSLSRFIYGNYKQALGIISTKNTVRNSMREAGIASPQVFYDWLVEEGEYLQRLYQTPPKETLEMEYYLKLEALKSCQERLAKARAAWLGYQPGLRDQTNALKTKHRNESENERKLLADVQAFEARLELRKRWTESCDEYKLARTMVKEASYRKALDKLEALLVSRCFEMARLNLRKHIANALKTRSKSIQSAIASYNEAATALFPPRQTITWEEVLEFSFLGEFDILRNARDDVRTRQWATFRNRLIMQQFFRLIRAEEEIDRLHVEIRRLLTYICEEE